MTREQAQRKALKLFGSHAHIEAEGTRSSPELRAVGDEEFQRTKAYLEAAEAELAAKLSVCEWYQELTKRIRELRQQKERAGWIRIYRKFSVGTFNGIGFHVRGRGDTWEEAFAATGKDEKK